jgi:hypothetical protein
MSAVTRFCDRAMLLERGNVRMVDEPQRVADEYVELNFGRDRGAAGGAGDGAVERYGDGAAELVDSWFENDAGERSETLKQGHRCTFRARVVFRREVVHPAVAVVIEDDLHNPLMATSTDWAEKRTGTFGPGDEAVFSIAFDNPFAPGRVHATPWVAHRGGQNIMDRRPRMASALIAGTLRSGALVDIPHDVTFEHAGGIREGRATHAIA